MSEESTPAGFVAPDSSVHTIAGKVIGGWSWPVGGSNEAPTNGMFRTRIHPATDDTFTEFDDDVTLEVNIPIPNVTWQKDDDTYIRPAGLPNFAADSIIRVTGPSDDGKFVACPGYIGPGIGIIRTVHYPFDEIPPGWKEIGEVYENARGRTFVNYFPGGVGAASPLGAEGDYDDVGDLGGAFERTIDGTHDHGLPGDVGTAAGTDYYSSSCMADTAEADIDETIDIRSPWYVILRIIRYDDAVTW